MSFRIFTAILCFFRIFSFSGPDNVSVIINLNTFSRFYFDDFPFFREGHQHFLFFHRNRSTLSGPVVDGNDFLLGIILFLFRCADNGIHGKVFRFLHFDRSIALLRVCALRANFFRHILFLRHMVNLDFVALNIDIIKGDLHRFLRLDMFLISVFFFVEVDVVSRHLLRRQFLLRFLCQDGKQFAHIRLIRILLRQIHCFNHRYGSLRECSFRRKDAHHGAVIHLNVFRQFRILFFGLRLRHFLGLRLFGNICHLFSCRFRRLLRFRLSDRFRFLLDVRLKLRRRLFRSGCLTFIAAFLLLRHCFGCRFCFGCRYRFRSRYRFGCTFRRCFTLFRCLSCRFRRQFCFLLILCIDIFCKCSSGYVPHTHGHCQHQ